MLCAHASTSLLTSSSLTCSSSIFICAVLPRLVCVFVLSADVRSRLLLLISHDIERKPQGGVRVQGQEHQVGSTLSRGLKLNVALVKISPDTRRCAHVALHSLCLLIGAIVLVHQLVLASVLAHTLVHLQVHLLVLGLLVHLLVHLQVRLLSGRATVNGASVAP